MIDALLLVGGTRQALEAARGAVDDHLRHLKTKCGLDWETRIVQVKGKPVEIYAFKDI